VDAAALLLLLLLLLLLVVWGVGDPHHLMSLK
jgi:hypothetical protein